MQEQYWDLIIKRPKSQKQLRAERRWRILEDVLNVLIGVMVVATMFYAGWLVGSGAVRWPL